MGVLQAMIWPLFSSPQKDPFVEKSPRLLVTPCQFPISNFSLPSGSSSSASSSGSSLSSSSTFWVSPRASAHWSPSRYLPSSVRNNISKRQAALVLCLSLALLVWFVPPPRSWHRHIVHITIPQASNPYQVLRPDSPATKKAALDPLRWLEHNSGNKFAVSTGFRGRRTVSPFPPISTKPRAALISLVRNSELPGLMQSMRQLEYQWNRKYQYPWVFFNDEPFNDEFKVCTCFLTLKGFWLIQKSLPLRILHQRNATTKLFQTSIGQCQIGLMKAGS